MAIVASPVLAPRHKLPDSPSNAYLDETAYCYIGEDLVPDLLASDDDEFFERRVIPFREAVTMAANDDITESVSKVAILVAAIKLGVPR